MSPPHHNLHMQKNNQTKVNFGTKIFNASHQGFVCLSWASSRIAPSKKLVKALPSAIYSVITLLILSGFYIKPLLTVDKPLLTVQSNLYLQYSQTSTYSTVKPLLTVQSNLYLQDSQTSTYSTVKPLLTVQSNLYSSHMSCTAGWSLPPHLVQAHSLHSIFGLSRQTSQSGLLVPDNSWRCYMVNASQGLKYEIHAKICNVTRC